MLYCYAHITVNGEEWGLYLAIEALEDSFAERYYGLDHGQLYKVEGTGMGGADGERELPEAGELPDGFQDAAFGEMPSFEDGEFPGFPGQFAGAADGTGGSSDNEIPAENEPENGETFGAPGLPGEEAENSGENGQSAFSGQGEMEGGRGGMRGMNGGFGNRGQGGMADSFGGVSSGSGNAALLAAVFAGAVVCVAVAWFWPRRRMHRGSGVRRPWREG